MSDEEYSEIVNRETAECEAEVRRRAARHGIDPEDFETLQDCDLYMQLEGMG